MSVPPSLEHTMSILHVSPLLSTQCAVIRLLFKHCLPARANSTCPGSSASVSGFASSSVHSIRRLVCTYAITRPTPFNYNYTSIQAPSLDFGTLCLLIGSLSAPKGSRHIGKVYSCLFSMCLNHRASVNGLANSHRQPDKFLYCEISCKNIW